MQLKTNAQLQNNKIFADTRLEILQKVHETPSKTQSVPGLWLWLIFVILGGFMIICLDLNVHDGEATEEENKIISRLVPTAMSSMILVVVLIKTLLLTILVTFANARTTNDGHLHWWINLLYKAGAAMGFYFVILGGRLMYISVLYFDLLRIVPGLLLKNPLITVFEESQDEEDDWNFVPSDVMSELFRWLETSGLLLKCLPTFTWLLVSVVSWCVIARALGTPEAVRRSTLFARKPEVIEELEVDHLQKYGRWLCVWLAVNVFASFMTLFTYTLSQILGIGMILEAYWNLLVALILVFVGSSMFVFYLKGIGPSSRVQDDCCGMSVVSASTALPL